MEKIQFKSGKASDLEQLEQSFLKFDRDKEKKVRVVILAVYIVLTTALISLVYL